MEDNDGLRRISETELRNLAEDSGERGAQKILATVLSMIDVNINNPEDMRKFRDAMFFLFKLYKTSTIARNRFWLTFLTILSGALILAVWQSIWDMIKSKIH